jgi:hypothetical protein
MSVAHSVMFTFTLHTCRWTNHPHRVLKRFIETKVPPGTPDAVMAQTGTENKKKTEGSYYIIHYYLFNDVSNSLEYVASNDRLVNK